MSPIKCLESHLSLSLDSFVLIISGVVVDPGGKFCAITSLLKDTAPLKSYDYFCSSLTFFLFLRMLHPQIAGLDSPFAYVAKPSENLKDVFPYSSHFQLLTRIWVCHALWSKAKYRNFLNAARQTSRLLLATQSHVIKTLQPKDGSKRLSKIKPTYKHSNISSSNICFVEISCENKFFACLQSLL